MHERTVRRVRQLLPTIVALFMVWLWLPPATSQASPALQPSQVTVELMAVADARTQAGAPDVNYPSGFLWVGLENVHRVYVDFDLSVLPANAVIDAATLTLEFTGNYTGTKEIEVGRADGAWSETDLTWNNQPAVTWNGNTQMVDMAGDYDWNILPLVQAWQDGSQTPYGVALRGLNDGLLKQAYGKDNQPLRGPRLTITYSRPADADPTFSDLGDAPDSSNHHNIINTAYPGAGVAGRFPTVYDVSTGQPAGPRHINQSRQAILGQHISREAEADQGPDQDGRNNILRSATGVIADVSDMDRGDDGWRNRNIKFSDCRKQTLTVRVSKANNATLNRMYLNVWFDGNRDGDWQDIAPCRRDPNDPAEASYEWIVQDHIIDLTAIPAGGYLDFQVDTERVLNSTPNAKHWMRFTLSEARAVQPNDVEFPDGRGPSPEPNDPDPGPGGFEFGETEDVLQLPPPAGEDGELIIEKRVITAAQPVPYAGDAIYEIRLRHDGGSQPLEAELRDELPYPLHLLRQIDSSGNIFLIDVQSSTGGASPLAANLEYNFDPATGAVTQMVEWAGTLLPNSEVTLSFEVHVHPICPTSQNTTTITNTAQGRSRNGDNVTATVDFTAACPGYIPASVRFEAEPLPLDDIDGDRLPWRGEVWNQHPVPVTLGFYQIAEARAEQNIPLLGKVTLAPNEKKQISLSLKAMGDLTLGNDTLSAKLGFCFLPGEDELCPNPANFPNMHGEAGEVTHRPRRNDLGDAPDSSNHFAGVAMTAYPGVEAHFPTVFDPATGLPEGPRHLTPQPFHLGPLVSPEREADLGGDADGVNNLVPPANTADLDWFDDGSQLTIQGHCRPARADVRVAIRPAAVAWFQEKVQPAGQAYLNIWLDMNRDGDWEDRFTCEDGEGQTFEVVEHILIDYPVDVAGLGAGLHPLNNIITRRIVWNPELAQRPAWVRFTLSEIESNKTLTTGTLPYGDGRGYPTPFQTGETEDHLRYFVPGGENDNPDFAIRLRGKVVPVPGSSDIQVRYQINTANLGTQVGSEGIVTFEKPQPLRGIAANPVSGPGLQPGDVTQTDSTVTIALPNLQPGDHSTIALGFTTAVAAREAQQMLEDLTATARVVVNGDANLSNNEASTTISRPHQPLVMGIQTVDGHGPLRQNQATCQDALVIALYGEPGQQVELLVNGVVVYTEEMTENGLSHLLDNLAAGNYNLEARYVGITSPRDAASGLATGKFLIDTSLPVDPKSLKFVDSQGNEITPPETLSFGQGGTVNGHQFRNGETYTVMIDSCGEDSLALELMGNNDLLARLYDDDGDSTYTGSFTFNAAQRAAASQLMRLIVATDDRTEAFNLSLETEEKGIIRNVADNQPIEAATITALVSDGVSDEPTYTTVSGAISSSDNPQMTGNDGAYGFVVSNGQYRLLVEHPDYQPYQSSDIQVNGGTLAVDLNLSPAISQVANQIIYLTENGFEPAVATIKPGDVVMWVNVDLADHSTVQASNWNSGLLATNQTYKVKLDAEGQYAYQDGIDTRNTGLIIVTTEPDEPGTNKIFLPVIMK